jgi:PBP1b-binding outer membrane lipoprotein LpoB
MKRSFAVVPVCIVFLILLASCSSNPKVSRVDAGTRTDLSGYWNNTDVTIVCDSLVSSFLQSSRVTEFIARKGELPVILIGSFRNESDEHIDTSIITTIMEQALFDSGKALPVAGGASRGELRVERTEQQSYASEATAAALANELGADFLLTGTVRTIVDQAGKTTTRTYYVSAELSDIETTARLWMGQNNEIKKVIVRPSTKL